MPVSRIDQVLIAVAGALVVALGGIGWALVSAASEQPSADQTGVAIVAAEPGGATPASVATPASADLVVDVQGAVLRPGLYHLVPGARVGDAVAAAGGYDSSVDLDAAAMQLNLAALLSDGEKVVVPRLGAGGDAAGSADAAGSEGGLVNVNTADAAALEELPGIGPVTAEKIIAAREDQPFQSLEEMVERGVINNGQLDKIRDLATTG